MANLLSDDQRAAIKEDWIDTWYRLLKPFYDREFDLGMAKSPPELVFILEP